jgi:hypothetical protein
MVHDGHQGRRRGHQLGQLLTIRAAGASSGGCDDG